MGNQINSKLDLSCSDVHLGVQINIFSNTFALDIYINSKPILGGLLVVLHLVELVLEVGEVVGQLLGPRLDERVCRAVRGKLQAEEALLFAQGAAAASRGSLR